MFLLEKLFNEEDKIEKLRDKLEKMESMKEDIGQGKDGGNGWMKWVKKVGA